MSLTELRLIVKDFSIGDSIVEVEGENDEIEFACQCPVCKASHYNRKWTGVFNAVGECLSLHREHIERNPDNGPDLDWLLAGLPGDDLPELGAEVYGLAR